MYGTAWNTDREYLCGQTSTRFEPSAKTISRTSRSLIRQHNLRDDIALPKNKIPKNKIPKNKIKVLLHHLPCEKDLGSTEWYLHYFEQVLPTKYVENFVDVDEWLV